MELKRKTFPFIVIRKAAFFPLEKVPLILEGQDVIDTINASLKDDSLVVAAFQKNGDVSSVGILCKILQFWSLSPSIMGIIVEGKERLKLLNILYEDNIKKVEIEELYLKDDNKMEVEAFARSILNQFQDMVNLSNIPLFIMEEIKKSDISPGNLGYIIASILNFNYQEKIELIEESSTKSSLEKINVKLAKELNILKTEKKIQHEVEKEVGKTQKDFILRERMKAIEKELGIFDEYQEYENFQKKIKESMMPPEVEKVALKELNRLRATPPMSAESPYIRTYIDWLADLPWNKKNESILDLKKAKQILDEDHYGLEKVKERILEYLAVQKLTGGRGSATIMCFVGPPGTGKTSVGRSIAKALNRKFFRLSLGGIHDEAEIRGHRRTYVGALPGRIIQGIKTVQSKNPIFMLDEIDKIGNDFRGDPGAALLEVLDPEQNNSFSDHYLEVPFDLSEVIFITTANILESIPLTLRDRMEIIEFSGYTDEEKLNIAIKFLFPKVLSSHGLSDKNLVIKDAAIKKIINKYTREAGVRNLERKLAEIARKIAKKITENGKKETIVNEGNVSEYLGPEEFKITMREAKDEIGISTGIAWTPMGGEIIFVEAAIMPGKGDLILTGQLGQTMQESAKAALSYIRSKSKELDFDSNVINKSDVHVHVPSGAIPKDGPSAGIAIAVAIASAITHKKVKKEVALSGEITLSGKVLEIGGLKEKTLAAQRAGVDIIIFPQENEKNLTDIPSELKKKMDLRFVMHMDEVLKIALI